MLSILYEILISEKVRHLEDEEAATMETILRLVFYNTLMQGRAEAPSRFCLFFFPRLLYASFDAPNTGQGKTWIERMLKGKAKKNTKQYSSSDWSSFNI